MNLAARPPRSEWLRASGLPPVFHDAEWFTQPTDRVPRRTIFAPIAMMAVYVDTAQAFFRSVRDTDRRRISDAMHEDGDWFLKENKIDLGITGYHLKAQLPQPGVADEIDQMLAEERGFNDDQPGSLTRLDFSIDFLPLSGWSREEIDEWLFAHLIMRNRRAAPLFRFDGIEGETTYFNKNAHRHQNSRDVVHYSDRRPKHTSLRRVLGREPITHLDFRLRGKRTLDRMGIASVGDALAISPADVVRRALYFTSVDIRPHAEADALATAARYADPRLREAYINRKQFNFAQRVKERLGIAMPQDPIPPLLILPELLFL